MAKAMSLATATHDAATVGSAWTAEKARKLGLASFSAASAGRSWVRAKANDLAHQLHHARSTASPWVRAKADEAAVRLQRLKTVATSGGAPPKRAGVPHSAEAERAGQGRARCAEARGARGRADPAGMAQIHGHGLQAETGAKRAQINGHAEASGGGRRRAERRAGSVKRLDLHRALAVPAAGGADREPQRQVRAARLKRFAQRDSVGLQALESRA